MTAIPAGPAPSPRAASDAAASSGLSEPATGRYGPSALLTPANALTIGRLALSPLLIVAILRAVNSWPTFVLGGILCFSDGIDGHLARRHGTTRSGAFLDPLADKVLVLGALTAMVIVDKFSIVPVVLIAVRELGISVYRSRFAREGLAIPARTSGKLKTIIQELAVALAIFPPLADHTGPAVTVLWVAVALTWISGVQYLLDGRSATTTLGHRTDA